MAHWPRFIGSGQLPNGPTQPVPILRFDYSILGEWSHIRCHIFFFFDVVERERREKEIVVS
jgi:hypothetical protein